MTKIKIYSFAIENETHAQACSAFLHNLIDKLSRKESAAKRFMTINESTKEQDLLSYYIQENNSSTLFGMMIRIAPAENVATFSPEYFNNIEQIEPQELINNSLQGAGLACTSSYYFMIDEKHLVTTLPKSRISSFRTYMNWLLEYYCEQYKFSCLIELPQGTQLREIQSIIFSDQSLVSDCQNQENIETRTSIIPLMTNKIKDLFSDTVDIQKLMDKNLLSANLVLKVGKITKKMEDDDEIKKALSAVITPMSDDDGMSVKLKNNKTIKSGSMSRVKEIEIETTDRNALNEQQLKSEMKKFLNEIKDIQR